MKQIYVIKNIINGKVYVGQASNAYDRFRRHRNNKVSAAKQNLEIIKAMKELGADNFYYVILENCEDDMADEREIYYIEKFNSFKNGYNRTTGGAGTNTFTKDDIDEFCRMFEQGKTIKEIETETSADHYQIKRELEKRYPDYRKRVNLNAKRARVEAENRPVIQYDLQGNLINRFASSREALRHLGKDPKVSSITLCCKHIKNYNTAYGYKWEFDTQ